MAPDWKPKKLPNDIFALEGGEGPPVVLLAGWPETCEAYTAVFEIISQHHKTFAVDLPGIGNSGPSNGDQYDTSTISKILKESLESAIDEPYNLVGHDVGMWVAYAWASQFPDKVKSLTVLDAALPGLAVPQSFPLPYESNIKLWQFSFNTLPDLPEILTKGNEKELLNWLFNNKAKHPDRITPERRAKYVEAYSKEGAMSRGFAYYRCSPMSATQNRSFSETKLKMPVLALGGDGGAGIGVPKAMELVTNSLRGGLIEDCGHYVMEEKPEVVGEELLRFFKDVE